VAAARIVEIPGTAKKSRSDAAEETAKEAS
jgi:hypothetical protein